MTCSSCNSSCLGTATKITVSGYCGNSCVSGCTSRCNSGCNSGCWSKCSGVAAVAYTIGSGAVGSLIADGIEFAVGSIF